MIPRTMAMNKQKQKQPGRSMYLILGVALGLTHLPTQALAGPETDVRELSPDIMARGGGVILGRRDFKMAAMAAWVEQALQHGKLPPRRALESTDLRRRIATTAVRDTMALNEAINRGLIPSPADWQSALWDLAASRLSHEDDIDLYRPHSDAALYLDAILFSSFQVPVIHVENAVARRMQLSLLEGALLDDIPQTHWRKTWLNEKTTMALELVMVPRVPTSLEIDAAVSTLKDEMPAYRRQHRRLFFTPARTFVTGLVLPKPKGREELATAERSAKKLYQMVKNGHPMEAMIAKYGTPRERRNGGRRTLTQAKFPGLFKLKKGEISPLSERPKTWSFYRIDGHGQEVNRPLSDGRVQREIAAALLREKDDLPHAQSVAKQVSYALKNGDTERLNALIERERLKHINTKTFPKSRGDRIPHIGLAPELAKAVFTLQRIGTITPPIRIRQNYVIARLTQLDVADLAAWPIQRDEFIKQRKARERSQAVSIWINTQLRGRVIRVNGPALTALTLDDLILPQNHRTPQAD